MSLFGQKRPYNVTAKLCRMRHGHPIALVIALLPASSGFCSGGYPLDWAETNVCGQGAIHVCPSTLSADSAATLRFLVPHPSGFAIRRPDGSWVDLAGVDGILERLADFSTMTGFSFVPATLTGTEWINGQATLQRVFRGSGRYVFYFADNMDTEPENTNAIALAVEFVE